MKYLQKKHYAVMTLCFISLLLVLVAWKLLVTFDVIHLNQLAPRSYSRTGSTHGLFLVFLMPILATGMLFLGLTWKKTKN